MFKNRDQGRRWGAIGPLTAIMLIPMVAMVAFAVDLGHVWRTEAELQNAADSAALAGVARLIDPNFYYRDQGNPLTSTEKDSLRVEAINNAKAEAQTFAEDHKAGMIDVAINLSDVKVGYIADPSDASSPFVEDDGTDSTRPFPNSVQVTTRRDDTVSSGRLQLYFAGIVGTTTMSPTTSATASLRQDEVIGFKGDNTGVLPVVMHYDTYRWLNGDLTRAEFEALHPELAGFVEDQDYFTVQSPLDSGLSAPDNVQGPLTGNDGKPANTRVPDGRREGKIYGYKSKGNEDDVYHSGNWGLLDLQNGVNGAPGNDQISDWILNGPTGEDLDTWGEDGFQATQSAPLTASVQTGFQSAIENEFIQIIGEQRVMPVFSESGGGGGQGATYQIVGFVGIAVVDVRLKGAAAGKSYITVQTTTVMVDNPNAILASSSSSSYNYQFQGMYLSR